VTYEYRPARIVSLCPSLTETLFALGLDAEVVGRTAYCGHPADFTGRVAAVGEPKQVEIQKVLALRPDLVIADKEENRQEDVEALTEAVPVYVVDVTSYEKALRLVEDLGMLVGRSSRAAALVEEISAGFARLPRGTPHSVAYLVWKEPLMVVGQGTYIHSVLGRCGFTNACASLPGRYPKVTIDELRACAPEVVLLASEPFPFSDAHIEDLAPQLPDSQLWLVDGEMFGWYGSRMVQAADYLAGFCAELESSLGSTS